MNEPTITVNGHTLTEAEAMTVRVALYDYATQLGEPDALGDDQSGRELAAGYLRCTRSVMQKMNS